MNNKKIIEGYNLPEPLTKCEVYDLLEKIKQGDMKARTKLAEHNIKLVIHRVMGRFKTVDYDKEDLVSIGIIGLMKSVDTFDISSKLEFSTYAARCIDNEILMFLRKLKKHEFVKSLDEVIGICNNNIDSDDLKMEQIISSDIDVEEQCIDKEIYYILRQIVERLPERDRKIIMLHFGFVNDRIYSQKEVAEILNISQAYVSRLISSIVKRIGEELENVSVKSLKTVKVIDVNVSKRLKTIYEYLNLYQKEDIDIVLENLSEEEKVLIQKRYGNDLNNPVFGKMTKMEKNRFYGKLIPKIKRLLNERQNKTTDNIGELKEIQCVVDNSVINNEITEEDYLKILELLKTPSFTELMGMFNDKEAVIVALKLGYVDGKCFSTEQIADFLEIDKQEVVDTTKKVLYVYKEKINKIIDSAIHVVTDDIDINSAYSKVFHK